jgi:hypothetical protein
MATTATALAINSYTTRPNFAFLAGGAYLALLVLFAVATFRQRAARDQVQGEVLSGLFSHINQEIFGDDHRTRFTLFQRAPLRPDEIIPWYRYSQGGADAITEARRSRARYERGEGVTGRAWEQLGVTLIAPLGPYVTREGFERDYVSSMGIRPEVAKQLSRYMQEVQTIIAHGFKDGRGRLLGVLSLDVKAPLVSSGEVLQFQGEDDDEAVVVDHAAMLRILDSVGNVLESFQRAGTLR